MLVLSEVKLVPSKHIQCFYPLLFVFKQVAFLLSIIDTFRVQSFAQNLGEDLDVSISVIH